MNAINSGTKSRRAGALVVAFAFTVGAAAQFVPPPIHWDEANSKENWVSFSGGVISVDGSDATYQKMRQHDHSGFLGVDVLRWKRYLENDQTLTVTGHALAADNEYGLAARFDNPNTGLWFEGGWKESRVFYDGSGGYLPTNGTWFVPFDPSLAIDRGEFWLEGGKADEKGSTILRYSHQYRNGRKDSTTWADTNLTSGLGTRNLVPAFYDIDETRDILTLEVEYIADENATYGAGVRWENIKTDDSRNMQRRPGESSERFLTHRDETDADMFSAHAFGRWQRGEKLTLSTAAARTKIDTNFSGSRIYGSNYNAVFDPTFSRRQQRDEGYANLDGDSQWRQTLLTANALYLPAKHWRISGGLRYENQRQEAISEFAETNVGAGPAFVSAIEELAGESARHFDEILGTVEADYTGMENVVWGVFAEIANGNGNLREDLVEVENGVVDIARDTDFSRDSHKFGVNFRWYPSTTVNGAVGAYHKLRDNGYDTSDDTTPNLTGGDRYPAYIVSQKFSTDDLYVRGTWRPVSSVSIIGRYDYQQTDVDSREDGLNGVLSSEMTTHIMAGTISWMAASSVVVQGTINYVYDQIVTPAAASTQPVAHVAGRFDNNYRTATLLALFAVDDRTDVQVDATLFQANNYRNFAEVSMPYGLTARDRTMGLSVTRRVNEDLAVSLRYARAEYDDTTSGGNRDFTADMLYGRLQLRF